MAELVSNPESAQEVIIATIGNQKNPAQVVEIVHQPENEMVATRGISTHFNLKEIAVPQNLMLAEIHEMTGVVSYLLERIATAADLDLPFKYEPEFRLGNSKFLLKESKDFMILTRDQ